MQKPNLQQNNPNNLKMSSTYLAYQSPKSFNADTQLGADQSQQNSLKTYSKSLFFENTLKTADLGFTDSLRTHSKPHIWISTLFNQSQCNKQTKWVPTINLFNNLKHTQMFSSECMKRECFRFVDYPTAKTQGRNTVLFPKYFCRLSNI